MIRSHHEAIARALPAVSAAVLSTLLAFQLSCGGKKSTAPVTPTDPRCTVSATNLAFGSVPVGSSATRSFRITNSGGGTLTGSVGVSCADFALVGSADYSLSAGQSATFTVRFTPSTGGAASCAVTTGCTNVNCTASGQAAACEITADTLRFYRGADDVQLFEIQNHGSATLSGTVHVPGPDFTIWGDSVYALAPGEGQYIPVKFIPTASGVRSCAVNTGSAGCAQVICTGIGAGCDVAPTELDLGSGWDWADEQFTIGNPDSFPLLGAVSQPYADLTLALPTTYTIAPGQSQAFTVAWLPQPPVAAADRIYNIDTGAGTCRDVRATVHNPYPVPVLLGGGCIDANRAQSFDFGTLHVGQSATLPLTLGNGCGSAEDPFTAALIEYADDLTLGPTAFSAFSGGETRQSTATYTATRPGVHHIRVQIYSGNPSYAFGPRAEVIYRAVVLP